MADNKKNMTPSNYYFNSSSVKIITVKDFKGQWSWQCLFYSQSVMHSIDRIHPSIKSLSRLLLYSELSGETGPAAPLQT